jgi:hypothetical protein
MEEKKKVILAGIIFIVLVAIGVAVYYFFIYQKPEQPAEVSEMVQEPAGAAEEKLEAEEEVEPIEVDLDESDEVVRELAKGLSSNPRLAAWLMSKDLIRKFVAAVDNIALGQSPRAHIGFFKPEGDFEVIEKSGEYFINPASYERYDPVAEVFASLDTKGTVTLYKKLRPALQEAYRELGYPEANFDDTLKKAIDELLKVPVVDEDIQVKKKIVTYTMVDPELEKLSPAQKHLLRMGPDNVKRIQSKLREMSQALGFR